MNTVDDKQVDPDIERAFKWLMSFLPAGEWNTRKAAIEQHLENILEPKQSRTEATEYYRLVGTTRAKPLPVLARFPIGASSPEAAMPPVLRASVAGPRSPAACSLDDTPRRAANCSRTAASELRRRDGPAPERWLE